MEEGPSTTIEDTIRLCLPHLDEHRFTRLLWRLRTLGVVDVIQFSYLIPENLCDILTPGESQQLLTEWHKAQVHLQSAEQYSAGWYEEPQISQEFLDRFVKASYDGDIGTIHHLLNQGVDPNCSNQNLFTALYNAAQNGFTSTVDFLLRHRADPNITCAGPRCMTPLYTAASRCHIQIAVYLLQYGAHVNARVGELGSTALTVAAEKGHCQMVALLLRCGADVNMTYGVSQSTALIIASSRGHLELVEMLLDAGANVNATQETTGSSALTFAAERGHQDVVRTLLLHGANSNATFLNGLTSAIIAADRGHQEVLTELLRCGAVINAVDRVGDSPLHCAARKGFWRIARWLLEHGANPSIENQDLETPMQATQDDSVKKLIQCYIAV
ncbi:ankyrin repeat and KH domain-containing protein 1-like isoform X1 [Lineus longissimus]|uniref:ankyrin repeat and KH domain-containing protein 1-like isoform X1 n=1 Tax=Lineus longissimus TaxID=88925 RepID=UPI00315C651F